MRVTRHNARGLKKSSQGFTAKHNDRNYDVSKANNIKTDKMKNNRYLSLQSKQWYSEADKGDYRSFDEVEHDFYDEHFREQYEATQERYKAKRNYSKMTDFYSWRRQKLHSPEETCIQIGNVDSHVKLSEMLQIGHEYIKAERNYYKQHNIRCTILNAAFHGDEAVGHMQIRRVYSYVDDDGIEKIGQNECLKRSDLSLPNPNKPIGKDNNYKMTVDADLRRILLDICEKHGLSIEREPERNAKHNRSKEKVVVDKERERAIQETIDRQTQMLAEHKENEILQEAERIRQNRLKRSENADDLIRDVERDPDIPRAYGFSR